LAEWRDERYYPATVSFVASHGIDVKFTNESTLSVQQQNMVKCGLVPVSCSVLARNAKSDWYEPAVIQSYYADSYSQQQGYVVVFPGQSSHTRYSLVVVHSCYNSLVMLLLIIIDYDCDYSSCGGVY